MKDRRLTPTTPNRIESPMITFLILIAVASFYADAVIQTAMDCLGFRPLG